MNKNVSDVIVNWKSGMEVNLAIRDLPELLVGPMTSEHTNPEELLVGCLASCVAIKFLKAVEDSHISVENCRIYADFFVNESEAVRNKVPDNWDWNGVPKRYKKKSESEKILEIALEMHVVIPETEDKEIIEKLFEKSTDTCFIGEILSETVDIRSSINLSFAPHAG